MNELKIYLGTVATPEDVVIDALGALEIRTAIQEGLEELTKLESRLFPRNLETSNLRGCFYALRQKFPRTFIQLSQEVKEEGAEIRCDCGQAIITGHHDLGCSIYRKEPSFLAEGNTPTLSESAKVEITLPNPEDELIWLDSIMKFLYENKRPGWGDYIKGLVEAITSQLSPMREPAELIWVVSVCNCENEAHEFIKVRKNGLWFAFDDEDYSKLPIHHHTWDEIKTGAELINPKRVGG